MALQRRWWRHWRVALLLVLLAAGCARSSNVKTGIDVPELLNRTEPQVAKALGRPVEYYREPGVVRALYRVDLHRVCIYYYDPAGWPSPSFPATATTWTRRTCLATAG